MWVSVFFTGNVQLWNFLLVFLSSCLIFPLFEVTSQVKYLTTNLCQFSEFRRAQTYIKTCLLLSLTTHRLIFGSFVLWVLFSMPAFLLTSPVRLTLTLQEIKREHSGFNRISEKMKGKRSREQNYCLGGSDMPWLPQPFF